jgi:hypothetical protein
VLGATAIQSHPIDTERLVDWLGTEQGDVSNLAFEIIRIRALYDVETARPHRQAQYLARSG